MAYFFLWIAFIIGVIDWIAVFKKWKWVDYIAKPAFMVALLIWLAQTSGFKGHLIWLALGLVFSLTGDVFLMLPREQFIAGLVSFLLGHLAYLVGFNATFPPFNIPTIILALLVVTTAFQIYRRIATGLLSTGHKKLRIPVLIYTIVISLMLLSALITLVRPEWLPAHALTASCGAMLFFLSDLLLAWNRFVSPLPNGRVLVRITYQMGQLLLTLGVASHFVEV